MVTDKSPRKRASQPPVERGQSLFEILEKARRAIPADEAKRHPRDGAKNLDHYLYGTSKQEP